MRLAAAFTISFFCICHIATAQAWVPAASEVLKPVYTQAAQKNKKVLVIFHASWCYWCRKMDSSLQDPAIRPLIDRNFEITHLTVYESPNKKHLEHPGALELLTQYGGNDLGIPYWLVFDTDGKLLADAQYQPGKNAGCPATEEEVAHFITVLRKTASLNEAELERIRQRFRQNDQ